MAEKTEDHMEESTMDSVEVASCTIEELFSDKIPGSKIGGKLSIPEYQRPYVWGEKEVTTLVNDLVEYYKDKDKPLYYIGSIILG